MAIDYRDKWELNIQHSLHAYLAELLATDWGGEVATPAEWPEDEKILMPGEYAARGNPAGCVRLPAISIAVRNSRPGRMIGLGDRAQENTALVQIMVQAVNQAQRQVLTRYVANRLRMKSLPVYDYEKYPDPGAAEVGRIEIYGDPATAENNSLGVGNPALRYGGVVTCGAVFVNL